MQIMDPRGSASLSRDQQHLAEVLVAPGCSGGPRRLRRTENTRSTRGRRPPASYQPSSSPIQRRASSSRPRICWRFTPTTARLSRSRRIGFSVSHGTRSSAFSMSSLLPSLAGGAARHPEDHQAPGRTQAAVTRLPRVAAERIENDVHALAAGEPHRSPPRRRRCDSRCRPAAPRSRSASCFQADAVP